MSVKKRLNLFLIIRFLLCFTGCKEQVKSPEEQLADFIKSQNGFEYRNFEVSGTGKCPGNSLRIVGDSNGRNSDLYLNVTRSDDSVLKLDFMNGVLYAEENGRAVEMADAGLLECLQEFYGTKADFERVAGNVSSFGDISVVEDEDNIVYSFTVPAGFFPVKMKSLVDLLVSQGSREDYSPPVNYRLKITADKTNLIKKIEVDDENQLSISLNLERYGGTTAVVHNVLAPHKYKRLTLYSGYEYEEVTVKGADYALTNNESYLELILYPRAEVDKMGWAGYLKEYGARYYDASDVVSYELIKEEKNRLIYTYTDNADHKIMLGLYDTPDGFYALMCVCDRKHFDEYETRFTRYRENVRW